MTEETIVKKLLSATASSYSFMQTWNGYSIDLWSPDDVDKLETSDLKKFTDIIKDVRFFYERDPIASTVINKYIEIGITKLIFDKKGLSENEYRIFTGMKDKLEEFAEICALEFLLSGLVVPEISYTAATKDQLLEMGIKKYTSMVLPSFMWLRDPTTIKINSSITSAKPSYFVIVPEDLIYFITHKGQYQDGTKDEALYEELLRDYPDFVAKVISGQKEILLDNPLIVRRRYTTKSPYPVPFLYPALEALKHKRNIRRMDYSIASRVISAIQLFQLGNDLFPVTEDDKTAFDDLKAQMAWRGTSGRDMERIFQLFANHTLQIKWITPDTATLLNESKYAEVNQDIFMGLGFPKILTTGETTKTQTSDPEFATISPAKSMENMQKKIIEIIKGIVREISNKNNLKDIPGVRFEKINLRTYSNFIASMKMLYDAGTISRETLDENFGLNYEEEYKKRLAETKKIEEDTPAPPETQLGNPNNPAGNERGNQPGNQNNPPANKNN